MTPSELNSFWNAEPVKIWVVTLSSASRRSQEQDRLIVRAKTKDGALKCAKQNSIVFSSKKCVGSARFADPVTDLHCVKREDTSASL